ncbi:MAG: vWA domain-containing protein, partial [Bacteroidota bacterium]
MHRILLIIIALYFLSVQAEAQAWKKNSKFRLSETQIELGDSVELSWEVPKAKNVWLNEKSNVVPLTGSMMVSPDTTTYYALTIQKNNRKSFTKRRKVNVVKPEVVFFSLPDSATDEDRITVRWQAEHADYVMIDGISDTLRKVGSAKVSYDTTRLVSLTAYGKYNKAVVTDTINIQIIEDYGISQNTIYRGDTLSISWKTKFSDYVWFQGMDTTLSSVGKLTVKPEKDTVYNLYVARQSGIKELYASFPVKVRKPNIRYFWGESSILKGDWATLSWSVNGYDYVSIDNIGSNLPRKGARRVSPDETTTYVLRVKDGDQEIRMEKTLKVFPYRKYIAGTRHVEQVHENMPLMLDILSVDRSNYPDKITLRAVVVDTAGYYISGLAAQGNNSETGYRFFRQLSEISEAGRKTLPFEVREVQESASTPYDISLVLDYSGSMGGTIRYLEEAVYHFIRQKYINDKISITKFDDKIKTEAPLFMDADSILQRFKFTGLAGFGGHTALYAATDRGLAELDSSKRHKVVILFTDGNENASFQFFGDKAVTANQLAKQLRDQKARLIIISYGTGTNTEILYELAALADGKIYFVQSPDFIQQV